MKDPLSTLRHAIRRDERRARAAVARLKRRAFVALAILGGVGILILHDRMAGCGGEGRACAPVALQGASLGLGIAAPAPAPDQRRPNPALSAALAAREAAQAADPPVAETPDAETPAAEARVRARIAAARAAAAARGAAPARLDPGAGALYFTDMLGGR